MASVEAPATPFEAPDRPRPATTFVVRTSRTGNPFATTPRPLAVQVAAFGAQSNRRPHRYPPVARIAFYGISRESAVLWEWGRQWAVLNAKGRGDPMNYLTDFDAFRGRIGNLYGKKNLCPPFELRRYAQGWWNDGIEPAHCIEQVHRHLEQCSHQYRCGSSDKGIFWVDRAIRDTWNPVKSPDLLLDFSRSHEWIVE